MFSNMPSLQRANSLEKIPRLSFQDSFGFDVILEALCKLTAEKSEFQKPEIQRSDAFANFIIEDPPKRATPESNQQPKPLADSYSSAGRRFQFFGSEIKREAHEFGAIGEELESPVTKPFLLRDWRPFFVGVPEESDTRDPQQPTLQNSDLVINFWNYPPKSRGRYEVPSSDHAAEIIGKKGKKILKLQEETKTKITSPKLGESPVFIVEGEAPNIEKALQEIAKQCTHFESIRNIRSGQSLAGKIHVPKALVGLVVGEGGRTIQRIQRNSATVIKTPKAEEDPIFIITSDNESLERAVLSMSYAVRLIKDHVTNKTFQKQPNIFLNYLFTLTTPTGSKLIQCNQLHQPFNGPSFISAQQSTSVNPFFSECSYTSSWFEIF